MKKKLLGVLLAATMVAGLVFGCGSEAPADVADGGDNDTIKIGFSSKTNADAFLKQLVDAAEEEAEKLGVEIVMTDAGGDVNKQISDCETLIAQQVDALIVIPQDMEGSAPVVGMAKEADIPVIVCNADIADKSYDAFVGSTDQEAGEILGTWFNDNVPEKSGICIIEGPMGQSGQVGRYAGFEAAGTLDNFNVLSEQTANWKRDEAMALAEDWLVTYGNDLKAIICENDDMALGALSACLAAGRNDVVIGGVDGLSDAVLSVQEGKLGVSVLQDSEGQGRGSVDVAVKIVKGEKYESDIRIPFRAITKDNVDAYLEGGVDAITK